MRFIAVSGSEVIGVTAHSSGSLRLACVGVLGHALRCHRFAANAVRRSILPVRTALEAAGVKFIDANGGGSGLRIGAASM